MTDGQWDWLIEYLLGPLSSLLLSNFQETIAVPAASLLAPIEQLPSVGYGLSGMVQWGADVLRDVIHDVGTNVGERMYGPIIPVTKKSGINDMMTVNVARIVGGRISSTANNVAFNGGCFFNLK